MTSWFSFGALKRLHWGICAVTLSLMGISCLVISAQSQPWQPGSSSQFVYLTPMLITQLKWFAVGSVGFLLAASFDYHRLRDLSIGIYFLMLLALLGVFFAPAINGVHRWYRLPFLGLSIQPGEPAKLGVIICLSWYLERACHERAGLRGVGFCFLIMSVPFFLILKEPDLGSAIVLLPITCGLLYFSSLHPPALRWIVLSFASVLGMVLLVYLGLLPFETIKPLAMRMMHEYQIERLNPDDYHHLAARTAMGLGGLWGKGWGSGDYASRGWLPEPYTDSVFPALGEEFGLFGMVVVLLLFYRLVAFGFETCLAAHDLFGKLLGAGISLYFATHVVINVGMMAGLLPITGVPLPLITYGGSSVLLALIALGLLQGIYARRYRFS